jgi:hypothetical protein
MLPQKYPDVYYDFVRGNGSLYLQKGAPQIINSINSKNGKGKIS